jgi:hypothetical protein
MIAIGSIESMGRHMVLALCALGLLSLAIKSDWTVISMKNDWKRIFAFE